MKKMPWVRFFASDWLAGTRGMTAVETGVYITLIATMYERGEPIVEDHGRLARLCGASNSAFKNALDALLDEGKITRTKSGLWNDRVEKEQVYVSEKSEVGRRAGLVSAQSRADKNAELRRHRIQEARQKGTHTEQEWEALRLICGSICVECGSSGPLEKDHIMPIYQGGSDGIENLQPLCRACNAAKGPKSDDLRPTKWRSRLDAILCEEVDLIEQNQQSCSTNVERKLNGRSTNQKPDTRTIKDTSSLRSDVSERAKKTPSDELAVTLDPSHVEAVLDHRRKIKKPLTAHAAKLLAAKFGRCPDANAAADAMISNGWQGFEPEWLERRGARGAQAPPKPLSPAMQRHHDIYAKLQRDLYGDANDKFSGTTVDLKATDYTPH